ncbi:hypothetical protein DICPUDRAFT_153632 [Dictyostelium purpureum]|uniref:Uncharacterized protein n=1 Tax=Dictyostelium purpureum TaxID=5786 RepID=F0ZPD7_DICPU|nr:uncharacterized protein DICPUDRAFT_153632 [Dictyostelium purpureum]EGC34172.1 hypothetical protein DICPUDRAFT_153632 [Dictyostelium purpureum]|eukprot:XP_003289276.1 hypothetical protein DICPUDRAFT_153632 [Dictyostelium purpureum]
MTLPSTIVLDEDEVFENNGSAKTIPVPKLNLKAINTPPSNKDSLIKTSGIYLLESTLKNSKKRDSPKDSTNPSLKKFKDSGSEMGLNTPVSPTPEVTHKLNMLLSSCDSPIDSPKDTLSPHTRSNININNILLNDNKNESFEMPNNFVTKTNGTIMTAYSSGSSSPSTSPSPSPPPPQINPTNTISSKNNNQVMDVETEKKYKSLLDEKNQMEKDLKNQINTLRQQLQQQQHHQQQQIQQVQQIQQIQQQQIQHQQQSLQQPTPAPAATTTTTSKSKNPLSSRSNPVGTNDPIIVQDYLLNEIKVLKLKIIESQNQLTETNNMVKAQNNKLDELRACFGDYKVQTEGRFSLIEERLHNYALKFGEIDKFIYPYYIYPSTPKTPVSPHQLTPKEYYNDPRIQMLTPHTPKPSMHQQNSSSSNNSNNNNNNNQNNPNISSNSPSNQNNSILNDDKKSIQQKLHQRIQLLEQQKQQSLSGQPQPPPPPPNTKQGPQPNSPKGPVMMDRQPMSPHSQVPNIPHPYVDMNGYPQDSRYYYSGFHPSIQYYQ